MKIIIEVYGGLVTNVYADGSAEVDVFDLDVSFFPDIEEQEEADRRAAELEAIKANPKFIKVW